MLSGQSVFAIEAVTDAKMFRWRVSHTRRVTFILFLVLAIVFSKGAAAQGYLTQVGVPSFTTALPVEQGFLNAANGNLHLSFEFGSYPERGSRPVVAGFQYDSRIWNSSIGTWQPTNAGLQGGWNFFTTVSPGRVSAFGLAQECDDRSGQFTIYSFTWTDFTGTQRGFNADTEYDPHSCDSNSPSGDGFATDASGYHMYVVNYTQATIYAPDGTQVYPSVKDANGNFFSVDGSGNVIDTVGRTPVTVTSNCNSNSNQTCYNVLNSQGTRSTFTVTTQTISVSTAFAQSGTTEYSGSITVIQSIKLPDSTTYQFSYDSGTTAGHYGVLTGITLPTGGLVTYGYTTFLDSYANKNRWVNSRVSGGGTWSYTPAVISTCGTTCSQKVTVTAPSTDTAIYTFAMTNGAWATSVQKYTGSTTLLSTVANSFDFSNSQGFVRRLTSTTTLPTPGGNNVTSQTKLTYADVNTMNVASVKDWKFYAGSSPTFPTIPDREVDYAYLPVFGHNIVNRVSQMVTKGGGGAVMAQTNFSYDDSGSLVNSSPATGIQNHDDAAYGISNTVRGNLTKIKRCTNLSACTSTYVQTALTYDTTGQVLSSQDPNTNTTNFGYGDNYFNDGIPATNPPATFTPSAPTNAYLSSVTQPTIVGSTSFGYYYGTGKRASATDPNSTNSFSHFLDSLDRLTHSYGPSIGGSRPWTLNVYGSTDVQVDSYVGIADASPSSSCSSCRHDQIGLDGLGRLIHASLVNDPEGQTKVDTVFDSNSRMQSASHAYRSISDPTYGLETPTYDGMNRVIKATHQDGAYSQILFGAAVGSNLNARPSQACSSSTYGLGYPTLFVDEAGKLRETWADGFGRTIEGDEPNSTGNTNSGASVCYLYDAVGNVTQIVSGSQTRTFVFDSLSRTTSVSLPEISNSSGAQCPVTYSYDANSNVHTRVAPAPNQSTCTSQVTTTYSYDALNRLTQISYSDGVTPPVKLGYDGTPLTGCTTTPPILTDSYPKGRRTSMCDASGAVSWNHDPTGRVLTESRTVLGTTKTIAYSYNLDGGIATVKYPSANIVTYTESNAQRLTSAKDTASSTQFAFTAGYAPFGALQTVIAGQISGGFAGVTESHSYNNRLEFTASQATSTAGTAMNVSLTYNITGGNNGSPATITNNVDSGRTETLGYDSLNRILSASSSATTGTDCWGQTFGPDGSSGDDSLANLKNINSGTQASPTCPYGMLSITVNANNHITTSAFAYDAAGNMTQDGTGTGYSYTYDPEGRLILATGMSGGPYCYIYDGAGLRVAKKSGATSCSSGTVSKLYWRSIGADTIAETDGTGSTTNASYFEYVMFSGRRIASRTGTGSIFYYFPDQVGSTRAITTGNGPGQTSGQLCYDAEFTPYGQEVQHTERLQTTACPPNYRFTGYEYDPETGFDYAFARYYSARLGRFLSADPMGGSIGNLQSHNAYSYVLNIPTALTDPSGLWCSAPGGKGDSPCNPGNSGGGGSGQGITGGWDPWELLYETFTEFGDINVYNVKGAWAVFNMLSSWYTTSSSLSCSFNVQLKNEVDPSKTQGIQNRLGQIFGGTKGLNGESIALNFTQNSGDVSLTITNASVLTNLMLGSPMGVQGGFWGSPKVYANNFPDNLATAVNFGSVGGHEVAHELLKIGDLNYDSSNPNMMMYDSAPTDKQADALLDPGSALWKFTPGQVSDLFKNCQGFRQH